MSVPSKDIIWGLKDDILDWPKLYGQFKGCRGREKKGWQNYVLPPPAKFQKKLNLQYESKTILSSYPI